MTDFTTLSLSINAALATAAIAAFFNLGTDSSFFKSSGKASELANKLFDQLSSELELVLAPLLENEVDIAAMLVNTDGDPLSPSGPRIKINENFRNVLDKYLIDGRDVLSTYRKLRDLVFRLDEWSKQLRRFTSLTLMLTAGASLMAALDKAGAVSVQSWVHMVLGVCIIGVVSLWLYYAIRIFLESNLLTDLESKHAHL